MADVFGGICGFGKYSRPGGPRILGFRRGRDEDVTRAVVVKSFLNPNNYTLYLLLNPNNYVLYTQFSTLLGPDLGKPQNPKPMGANFHTM